MRNTSDTTGSYPFLHVASGGIFLALAVLWIVVAYAPEWESPPWRGFARLAGYVGFLAMMVPYLHILRRSFRYRRWGPMASWMNWHIAASYVAFAAVLIHSRGRSTTLLTHALLWLTWIVLVSGVVGFYGQKILYLLFPHLVEREFGLERMTAQRQSLHDSAVEELGKLESLKKRTKTDPAPVVRDFCEDVTAALALTGKKQPTLPLSENRKLRAEAFASETEKPIVASLWSLIVERGKLDIEERLHTMGRAWLYVHGPAAWALFVLMIDHVVLSFWFGGF